MSVIRGPWWPREDPLAPARGLAIGVVLGVLVWAAIIYAVASLLRAVFG